MGPYRIQVHIAEKMAVLRSQYDCTDCYFILEHNVFYHLLRVRRKDRIILCTSSFPYNKFNNNEQLFYQNHQMRCVCLEYMSDYSSCVADWLFWVLLYHFICTTRTQQNQCHFTIACSLDYFARLSHPIKTMSIDTRTDIQRQSRNRLRLRRKPHVWL